MEKPKNQSEKILKGLDMYFNREVAENFAEREQNEKNFRVAAIADRIIELELKEFSGPLQAAELGGGAHPDRYDKFFERLLEDGGRIDWVDVSPYMLKLSKKYIDTPEYKNRQKIIDFIQADIISYLEKLPNNALDLSIMKYTIDHIDDLDELFELLAQKLKSPGRLVATIGVLSPELKSISTNARFLYNGQEFPENETRILKDGDTFTVKFLKESGNPAAGYLEGAETTKYYHSPEKIKQLAEKYGFEIFLGDWKDLVPEDLSEGEKMDQDILVLRKK